MSKRRNGRRGKYHEWITEEGLIRIEGWARDGLTNEQIAHNIGINPDTLYSWMKRFSEIADALKKGKEVVDRQVENALLKRALGFHFVEEVASPSGEVVQLTRYEKPDVTAAIFWLKNRKPTVWRNKELVDVNKVIAETKLIEQKTKLVQGVEKDTGLLDALIEGRSKYEQKNN